MCVCVGRLSIQYIDSFLSALASNVLLMNKAFLLAPENRSFLLLLARFIHGHTASTGPSLQIRNTVVVERPPSNFFSFSQQKKCRTQISTDHSRNRRSFSPHTNTPRTQTHKVHQLRLLLTPSVTTDWPPDGNGTKRTTARLSWKRHSTSVIQDLIRIFATTTKICASGGSMSAYARHFNAHHQTLLLAGVSKRGRKARARRATCTPAVMYRQTT